MHREKEKLRRRKQRQRIKDELDKLRRVHGELDDQLKKLKLAKEAKRNPSQHWSIWKELALVQRKERHRSETRREDSPRPQKLKRYTLTIFMDCFNYSKTVLHSRIESCRVKMDDILNGCGLLVMPTGVENSMHWCDESGELKYHQNLHKFTLPFDLETSQWSCWEPFKYRQRQCDREDYDGIEDSENTVALKFRVIRTMASGSTVSVVQWLVARRFIEHNRVSYIWKAYTEGEGIFRGMHSNQTGWGSLRPLPDGSGTLGDFCIRQFPVLFNAPPPSVNEFYHFLQAVLDEDKCDSLTVIYDSLPEHYIGV
ncbi:hypothetical protein L915_00961 [Phytophthora nicotianae]|uniref:Uncharacterized protein n=1 Tax=Phytophthora nicotianae TaxID=4792 RepID=W2HP07_PHYNI|nr:hypothetical protein L915_00961 [Phytophthora nicotianae]